MAPIFFINKMRWEINEKDKQFLLKLARESIKYFLDHHEVLKINDDELKNFSSLLHQKMACFVTLSINQELRGCVGCLEPLQPLYQAVIENAINAAFFDYRFLPLSSKELEMIEIEISILSPLKLLDYKNCRQLLNLLKPLKHGVLIRKGNHQATYLPQVWQQIPAKQDFLNSLCLKAGLPAESWKKEKIEVKIYQVENFKEGE